MSGVDGDSYIVLAVETEGSCEDIADPGVTDSDASGEKITADDVEVAETETITDSVNLIVECVGSCAYVIEDGVHMLAVHDD